MKTTFYFFLGFIILSLFTSSLAQEDEKIIYSISALGDTLDKEEREFYKLLPNVKDFEYARFKNFEPMYVRQIE